MSDSQQTLTLQRIREIFALNRGEAKKLADRLGKSETTVSQVLRGRATSRMVLEAAAARAQEILETQREQGRTAA